MSQHLYPITVKIADKPILVVGGGKIAAFKIAGLLRCGARITVVAPTVVPEVRERVDRDEIRWTERTFVARDVDGAFLVVSAVDDPDVTDEVVRAAHTRGLLVNAVDDPQRCDYYLPAVVRRGPLSLAVSIGGTSPGFAGVLARELDADLPSYLETWLDLLGEAREILLDRHLDQPALRHRLAKALARSDARQLVAEGDVVGARERLRAIIESEETT